MRLRVIACLLAATVASASTGSAFAATRTFPTGGFDRVRSNVPFDVRITTAGGPRVHAVGPDKLLSRLRVGVRNGELVIGMQSGSWLSSMWAKHEKLTIEVAAPNLRGVTLAGPGDIQVDRVRTRSFAATLDGPGDLSIGALETIDAELRLNGPGDITLAGRAERARIWLSGPGDVKAAGFATQDIAVDLTGPGDVTIAASRTANVTLTGPGDVHVIGHPHCTVSKHGPGDVTCG